jgi:hypothetical protein|uniref:Uncharacterized protein n=1 Tax=Zea mays TaxID=4577 RepID=A0A804LZZ9_MAIZE
MPSSPIRGGPGFRPWKTKLGNTTPSTGEAAPRSVAVAKAFAQENPQHNIRPGPRDKAHLHSRRRRPTNPHRPIQRANDASVATTVAKQRGPPPPPAEPTVPAEQRQHHAPHLPSTNPGSSRCDAPDPLACTPPQMLPEPLLPICRRHTPPLRSQILRSSPSHG